MAGKQGGKREGAGRKKTKSALPGGAAFADRVLARIKELKLKDMKTAEDLALRFLGSNDERIVKEVCMGLLFWKYGKPVQPISHPEGVPTQQVNVTIRRIGA